MREYFLTEAQRKRLVDLLLEDVEDYGLKEVAKYTGRSTKYISSIINETRVDIDKFSVTRICHCLAINPNYVYSGVNPIYQNDKRVIK